MERREINGFRRGFCPAGADAVGRYNEDGEFEIAFGHHRLQAGLEVYGPDYVHGFPVEQFDDLQMLRAMTDENGDDWSNPVEHGLLAVEAGRDWMDGYLDVKTNVELASQLLFDNFSTLKSSGDLGQKTTAPSEITVFVKLYPNASEAIAALRTAAEQLEMVEPQLQGVLHCIPLPRLPLSQHPRGWLVMS